MPTAKCYENIAKQQPPANHYCPGNTCADIQKGINEWCKSHSMGVDEPYITYAADGSGQCYCCCSCFAFGTPIEVQPQLYKLIQTINVGDTVLATGASVQEWKPVEVTHLGGIAPEVQVDFMMLGQFRTEDGQVRTLIASADHLFLNGDPAGSVLVPFGNLRPGHTVRTADGGAAAVEFTTYIQFAGGVRHIALGIWEPGTPLDGHLLNSNGLVTADLGVQMRYYEGSLHKDMVDTGEGLPALGSPKFHARYDTSAYTDFLNDPAKWPPNVIPLGQAVVNVPASALGYFTAAQAADIEESLGQQDLGNSMPLTQALYLFNLNRAFYPGIIYIVDWASIRTNAWFFRDNRQNYVVISGGLLRVPELMLEGVSVVLSHLIANQRGVRCTAEADLEGVRNELRELWYNELFGQTFERGLAQLEGVFARISLENRKGNPDEICTDPGIDCRVQALWAGAMLTALPDCAVPPPDFAVSEAYSEAVAQQTTVFVVFSKPYDQLSAADPANYVFSPAGVARFTGEGTPDTVDVVVEGLAPGTEYTVTVSNVYSTDGRPLTPGYDTAKFTTPAEES